jgi:hypothetical protein
MSVLTFDKPLFAIVAGKSAWLLNDAPVNGSRFWRLPTRAVVLG